MPGLAQCDAFVGERDGQEADALLFEHVGDFESAVAVAGCLDHRHHLFSFAQQAAEVVQVVDHVVEVDFQHGRMYLVFEDAADPFELEAASSFQQDAFFREARPVDAPQEIFGGQVELLAAVECPACLKISSPIPISSVTPFAFSSSATPAYSRSGFRPLWSMSDRISVFRGGRLPTTGIPARCPAS